jgi:hypothetical protein
VKSYHFLCSFFSYEEAVKEFVAFCEFIGLKAHQSMLGVGTQEAGPRHSG